MTEEISPGKLEELITQGFEETNGRLGALEKGQKKLEEESKKRKEEIEALKSELNANIKAEISSLETRLSDQFNNKLEEDSKKRSRENDALKEELKANFESGISQATKKMNKRLSKEIGPLADRLSDVETGLRHTSEQAHLAHQIIRGFNGRGYGGGDVPAAEPRGNSLIEMQGRYGRSLRYGR